MEGFGKYQVLRKIGAGGFGLVYEGYDPTIRRRVAIKTCTSGDPRVRLRFVREAEITGNLSHPNIVVVFDYGEVDGSPYLVQEFLDGEDLDAKIQRRETVPLGRKVAWLLQIADALAYAHRQGVIHRDVKPSNVRVQDSGIVKVMDFGIAWIKNHASITLTGRAVGTAAYMAPEQLRNEPAGPRADIFSFGVLAYELLTGERAFPGETPSEILYRVLHVEPVPIRTRNPDVPAELAALVVGCHRKDAEARYRSFDLLVPVLRHIEADLTRFDTLAGARPALPHRSDSTERTEPITAPVTAPVEALVPDPPLPQPPPSWPPALRHTRERVPLELDRIDLRAASPTSSIRRSGGAASQRRRRPPLWSVVLVVAVVALATAAAVARWQGAELRFDRTSLAVPAGDTAASEEAPEEAPASTGPPPAAEPARPVAGVAAAGSNESEEPPPPTGEPEPEAADLAVPHESSRVAGPNAGSSSSDSKPVPPRAEMPTGAAEATTPAPRPAAPRARPGALSVRAMIGSPQGWAWLDGRPLGRTPIRRTAVAAGEHRLRIALDPEGGDPAREWQLRIASGQELIVTVDTASGAPPQEARRPLDAP